MEAKEERSWFAKACPRIIGDALLGGFATFGVVATLCHWLFMVNQERMSEAPFLVTFTGLSNLAIGLVAWMCLLTRLCRKQEKLPSWLFVFRLVFTAEIMVTFLVTAVYLVPSVGAKWWALYINGSLFNHLLTPLWAIASFTVLEKRTSLRWTCCFASFIPMTAYGLFYMVRAYTHVNEAGTIDLYYDIYGLTRWGIWVTVGLLFAFAALSFGLCVLLYFLNAKMKKE